MVVQVSINIGELATPINTAVQGVCDAVASVTYPWRTGRNAKADAKALLIETKGRLESDALKRLDADQARLESITEKASHRLPSDVKPEEMTVEQDWYLHWEDKARLVSDEKMQELWANILAGEATQSGSFSKRTVNLLASLDKDEAELFKKLCTFVWDFPNGEKAVIIFDKRFDTLREHIYDNVGLAFNELTHLDNIGLIDYDNAGHRYIKHSLPNHYNISYFDKKVSFTFNVSVPHIMIGSVRFTQAGQQLARICTAEPNEEYFQHVLKEWSGAHVGVSIEVTNA